VADPDDEGRPPGFDPLSVWQRLIFGGLAVGGLGAGTTATFITKNSVGSGVLLALGAIFVLLAVTGNPIARAKFGENEVQFALRRAVQGALEATDEESRSEVAQVIVENLPLSEPVRRQAEAVLFEQAVGSAMLKIGAQSLFIPGHDQRFDMAFRYKEKSIAVNAKFARSGTTVKKTINEMLSILGTPSWSPDIFGMVLVISDHTPFEVVDGTVLGQPRIRLVKWGSDIDNDRLRATLDSLVADAVPPST
jgi:hypothetical protein